jgi:hypothetical protein
MIRGIPTVSRKFEAPAGTLVGASWILGKYQDGFKFQTADSFSF